MIALEDFGFAPLLQLALHVLAEAHVEHLVERGRVRPILVDEARMLATVCRRTARVLGFLGRGAQIAAAVIDNCVDFSLGMAIEPPLDRLHGEVARAGSRELQGGFLAGLADALLFLGERSCRTLLRR